ncbi:MAG: hypothetical protein EA382_04790 [Spirochaetaceae bacterium]|nr:MAG: hypothetical protein EA382_04790 [Spirochaetaceae bacterium]
MTPISAQRLRTAKVVLGLTIAVTSALPMLFVQLDEPSTRLAVYKVLAKTGSLVGGMFLLWQFFLGFRGAVAAILPDLSWIVELHKKLGQFGTLIIPLHPIFIGIYYLEVFDRNVYDIDLASPYSRAVLIGMVLLGVIAFVVISSAFFRKKMGFYRWFYTHLSSYLIPPLLIIHGFVLGETIGTTPFAYIWWGLAVLMVLFYAYRIAHKVGLFATRLRVIRADRAAADTTEVVMESQRRIRPALGQFVYLRRRPAENSHPYTVSTYDPEEGVLGVTAKKDGPQTTMLQHVSPGVRMMVDGPYGVFTRVALSTRDPLVMIAGGIGITPFRRVWQLLEERRDREAWLFYGNEFYDDIVYRDEIDALEHVRVVHVLNQEPDFPGDKGFITVDILASHLPRDLSAYRFLLCGPPVMVRTLESALHVSHVPDDRVAHELFTE